MPRNARLAEILCERVANKPRTKAMGFLTEFSHGLGPLQVETPQTVQPLRVVMRANIWRSLLSCISNVSPEIVVSPSPLGMPVSGSGTILA